MCWGGSETLSELEHEEKCWKTGCENRFDVISANRILWKWWFYSCFEIAIPLSNVFQSYIQCSPSHELTPWSLIFFLCLLLVLFIMTIFMVTSNPVNLGSSIHVQIFMAPSTVTWVRHSWLYFTPQNVPHSHSGNQLPVAPQLLRGTLGGTSWTPLEFWLTPSYITLGNRSCS